MKKLYNLPESLPFDQEAAIRHKEGPMLVLAGPGSGKTFVITHRIAHLISNEHIQPTSILVITFTKAAAIEMQQRANLLIHESSFVHFGTFHSIFYQILKQSIEYKHITLASDSDRTSFLRDVFRHRYADDESQVEKNVEACIREISIRKNQLKSNPKINPKVNHKSNLKIDLKPNQISNKKINLIPNHKMGMKSDPMQEKDSYMYQEEFLIYEKWLREHGLLDFDDMIGLCYDYLSQNPMSLSKYQEMFSYILIDEFQDINELQYQVVKLLAKNQNLFVVGDDDQSIYGFRGSNPRIMQTFLEEFDAKKIQLKYNYRSQSAIVEAAISLINHNQNRFYKNILAKKEKESDISLQSCESKRHLIEIMRQHMSDVTNQNPQATQAILLRTNSQKHFYETLLKVQTRGPVEEDLICYLKFINCGMKRKDFMQIMNKPMRYIPRGILLEEVIDYHRLQNRLYDRPWIKERLLQFQKQIDFVTKLDFSGQIRFIYKAMGYEQYAVEKYGTISAKQGFLHVVELIGRDDFTSILYGNEDDSSARPNLQQSVHIMTYHASKGLEFDCVYLPELNFGKVPHGRVLSQDEIEEERRMFYVALTRAKKNVFLFCDEKKARSPFLDELFNS